MKENTENKYEELIKKLTELRNILKYRSNYDYEKLNESIEILNDENENSNGELIAKVKDYLSTNNFFNVRWAYDWFMPNINGQYWRDYIYEIQKLCEDLFN